MSHHTRNRLSVTGAFLLLLLAACSEPRPALQPLEPGDVILAFGDSLTRGTGAGQEHAWPAVLERLSGHRVINAGVPGEITAEGLRRLPKLLDQHQPALVVLLHGGNDLLRKKPAAAIARNLEAMIDLIRQHRAQAVLIAVPQPALLLSDAPLYAQVAERKNLPVLEDSLSNLLGSSANRSDRVHLNATGYRLLAEQIHDFIKRHGGL
jgi:lysophospholipase L1-like esterase